MAKSASKVYYRTEYFVTGKDGTTEFRRYSTRSLTPMHASIRERFPAVTYQCEPESLCGIPAEFLETVGTSPTYEATRKAHNKQEQAKRAARRQARLAAQHG